MLVKSLSLYFVLLIELPSNMELYITFHKDNTVKFCGERGGYAPRIHSLCWQRCVVRGLCSSQETVLERYKLSLMLESIQVPTPIRNPDHLYLISNCTAALNGFQEVSF